jgi:hypothetical protein
LAFFLQHLPQLADPTLRLLQNAQISISNNNNKDAGISTKTMYPAHCMAKSERFALGPPECLFLRGRELAGVLRHLAAAQTTPSDFFTGEQ